jgi:multiple sugar transport system permease protein
LLFVALLLGALYAGFPVVWMLSSSFKSNTEIFAYPPRLIGETFSWRAYLGCAHRAPKSCASSSIAI